MVVLKDWLRQWLGIDQTVVYVVGRVNPSRPAEWDLVGIFREEAQAMSRCGGPNYFIGPMRMNSEEVKEWEGAYFPFREKRGVR